MNDKQIDELLQQAIDMWGIDAQIEMIEEEAIELALAIQKFKRISTDPIKGINAIYDELADMSIMLKQARKIYDFKIIDERINFKMNRLKKRLTKKADDEAVKLTNK